MKRLYNALKKQVRKEKNQKVRTSRDGRKITIVGRQAFQRTSISPRELVFLRREPDNSVDPNAIGAYKANGEQFGRVTRKIAAGLSQKLPLGVVWYGHIYSGSTGQWKCTIQLK